MPPAARRLPAHHCYMFDGVVTKIGLNNPLLEDTDQRVATATIHLAHSDSEKSKCIWRVLASEVPDLIEKLQDFQKRYEAALKDKDLRDINDVY